MKSCDLYLLTQKVEGLNYHEAVLSAGLSNKINVMYYARKKIYITQGRAIHFIDELLDKLNIEYHCLPIDQLLTLGKETLTQVLIILPTIEFEKIKELNTETVQFFHTYGTYQIQDISSEKITLSSIYNEEIQLKELEIDDFHRLAKLKVKPLNVAYKIINIKATKISKEIQRNCIFSNLKELNKSESFFDALGGWIKGPEFYSYLKQLLQNSWNQEFNKVSKYILVQSMQNGSSFFYRREYFESLSKVFGVTDKQINRCGNLWRKLARYLRSITIEEKAIDVYYVEEIMTELEAVETQIFRDLLCNEKKVMAIGND